MTIKVNITFIANIMIMIRKIVILMAIAISMIVATKWGTMSMCKNHDLGAHHVV